ncbi:MAG: dihydrodipicolinate synthase family protein [Candidatus Thermoplasmatota archaeon]|nr:dihydrodipicolinate synthase family protein [Candidatus Thermoplasmatota archaeon]MBS3790698.1 dihydrodipicolinate synthase family protein [Candidatus Thermoplasmatota archaeon]
MISGIIPPIITPFDQKGHPDMKALEHNLDIWNDTELSGYLALGSNGEFVYMSKEEKIKVVKKVLQESSEDKTVIAGTGLESTELTLDLTKRMAKIGVDAALVLPPHYYGSFMTDTVLKNHYEYIADNADIPILIYNMPKFTGITISEDLISILSDHKNIIGMKDSSGDFSLLGKYISNSSEDFDVMVGTANVIFGGLILGASGGILALANLAPEECCRLYQEVKKGNIEKAAEIQLRMIPLNEAITAKYGIKGLKKGMDFRGFVGGVCKRPLKGFKLTEEMKEDLKNTIEKY